MSKKKLKYISDYNKENYKMYQFRIRKNNAELIEKLENVSNRNDYITNLIANDINNKVLTIKQIKDRIRPIMTKYNIKEVYLFGSYARGEAKSSSDVDIYCEKGDADTMWKLSELKEELKNVLGKDVDIVTFDSEMYDFFRKQLEEDMIKLCFGH